MFISDRWLASIWSFLNLFIANDCNGLTEYGMKLYCFMVSVKRCLDFSLFLELLVML